MRYFLDTNVLMDDIANLPALPFVISSQSLIELEEIKTNRNKSDDVKAAARSAARWLADHYGEYEVVTVDTDDLAHDFGLDMFEPDVKICCGALYWQREHNEPVKFVTHDLCCRHIAQNVLGLDVEWFEEKEDIYKGYKEISGNTEYINNYMAEIDYSDWNVNEYCLIHNTDDETIKEMRFDGKMFVPLKLPPSKQVKARNALQRCALDLLNNQDITVCAILGLPGSGKSYLSVQYGLYAIREKGYQQGIITIREPISSGRESGYLPGTLDEKIGLYFKPIEEQLDGKEFELNSLQQRGQFESITPHYIKGRTLSHQYILCEEAEDLTEKQLRLIGTRVAEGSRIVFSGDYKQSEIVNTKNNALIKMCNYFKGNKKFGCIYLADDVRSDTSKMFAGMYF